MGEDEKIIQNYEIKDDNITLYYSDGSQEVIKNASYEQKVDILKKIYNQLDGLKKYKNIYENEIICGIIMTLITLIAEALYSFFIFKPEVLIGLKVFLSICAVLNIGFVPVIINETIKSIKRLNKCNKIDLLKKENINEEVLNNTDKKTIVHLKEKTLNDVDKMQYSTIRNVENVENKKIKKRVRVKK